MADKVAPHPVPVILKTTYEVIGTFAAQASPEELRKMLVPAADDLLETFRVTRELLRAKEPGPDLLTPVA